MELNRLFLADEEAEVDKEEEEGEDRAEDVSDGATLFCMVICDV